ncbi:putative regulator of septum formation [Halopolyspora algeriensis]|uniref:Putative regulator of septum formation n=1 Tax=Halopolyspora algeriensis TaxID=1500506 RepID=A0A368W111_9ACTN|nr:septum formation family protein [Halopolyspora algeriensis]RCW47322.1 putative regulator of septum formation [Halopolyspora algeriensis]TQM42557.1 putative regulator of septum formation [Halopolyspora algeriensis]
MAESSESPPAGPRSSNNGKRPGARLVMISAALGGLLVLVVSAVLNWPSSENGSRGVSLVPGAGSPDDQQAAASPPEFEADAGTCLNWTRPDAGDIRKVTCSEPHLFEVTGTSDLQEEFDGRAPFPSVEQWERLKKQRCTDVAIRYLGGNFDPNGRFQVGAFTPSSRGWENGDRTLHCGLQQPSPSGTLYRFTGTVKKLDQSDIHDPGTCMGINGTSVSGPVECSQPHSFEITGVVDLGEKFTEGYPPIEEQDKFLFTRCQELTAQYAGSEKAAEDKGLTVSWDNLTQQSWNAGSRKVNCKVGAQLPDDGGLAPITGSVKAEVTVGTQPAPSEPAPATPGAPASGTR